MCVHFFTIIHSLQCSDSDYYFHDAGDFVLSVPPSLSFSLFVLDYNFLLQSYELMRWRAFVLFAPDLLIHISKWFPVVYFSPLLPVLAVLGITKAERSKNLVVSIFNCIQCLHYILSIHLYTVYLTSHCAGVHLLCFNNRTCALVYLFGARSSVRRSPRRLPFDSNGIWQWLAVYFVWVSVCVWTMYAICAWHKYQYVEWKLKFIVCMFFFCDVHCFIVRFYLKEPWAVSMEYVCVCRVLCTFNNGAITSWVMAKGRKA